MECVAINVVLNGIVVCSRALSRTDIYPGGQNVCKNMSLLAGYRKPLDGVRVGEHEESTTDVLSTHHPIKPSYRGSREAGHKGGGGGGSQHSWTLGQAFVLPNTNFDETGGGHRPHRLHTPLDLVLGRIHPFAQICPIGGTPAKMPDFPPVEVLTV